MKWMRISLFAVSVAVLLLSCQIPVSANQPALSAQSAILLSAETGTVLYEKNASQQRGMASTTKIMTALLALEFAAEQNDPPVTVTDEMIAVEGSSMGLQSGDVLTLTNLTAGMMLTSGNDAANAIALTLTRTQEDFAEQMNRRAQALGLTDTHFVTPSGLDDAAHYSTAYDLAQLTRTALQNEAFADIVSQRSMSIAFQTPQKTVTMTNHNKLLSLTEGCIGVKTGYTKQCGRCLVSAVRRGDTTLIAVTLNAPDDWNDHQALYEYGFSQVESITVPEKVITRQVAVVGGQSDVIDVSGTVGGTLTLLAQEQEAITVQISLPRFLYAPVQQGECIGEVSLCLCGRKLFTVPITAEETVLQKLPPQSLWQKIQAALWNE